MIFTQFLTFSVLFVNFLDALDITTNTINAGFLDPVTDPVTIYSDCYWSIVDITPVSINYELILQANSMSIAGSLFTIYNSDSVQNDGIISINALGVQSYSDMSVWTEAFTNSGEIYMSSSGDSQAQMSIYASQFINTGLMVFYSEYITWSMVVIEMHGDPYIENDGQMCFQNHQYVQSTGIQGTGCMTALDGGVIYVQNLDGGIDSQHSFYLADDLSSLVVSSDYITTPLSIYGFGNGNKIGLTSALSYSQYVYNDVTGVLTLTGSDGNSQDFIIGTGYDAGLFEIVTVEREGLWCDPLASVAYNGPVPDQELPAACQIPCKDIPAAPLDDSYPMTTMFTTTWTTIDGEGSSTTESGIVSRVGTRDSTITTFAGPTSYTTTWTTTDENGDDITQSGIVSEHGDETITITTLAGPSIYTTTWTTTDSNGDDITQSGVVSEHLDENSTLTTFTEDDTTSDTTEDVPTDATTDDNSDVITDDDTTIATPEDSDSESIITWTSTNDDGEEVTNSGIISESGSELVTITTFSSEQITTWTTTDSNGDIITESGVVSENDSTTTVLQSEQVTIWTTTDTNGDTITRSGVVTENDSTTEIVTTFSLEQITTWTTTDSNGDTNSQSGVVSENDSTTEIITTFSSESFTTWTTTDSKGDTITQSGIISKGSTITTFSTTSWTTYTTTCSNGDVSTITSAVSPDSTIVVTITHCEEDICSEAVTTVVTTVPCSTVSLTKSTVTAIFTSCDNDTCSELTTTSVATIPPENAGKSTYLPTTLSVTPLESSTMTPPQSSSIPPFDNAGSKNFDGYSTIIMLISVIPYLI
ncbi:RBR3 Cell wall protein RBR3 [Candida maltosa Xu316]